MQSPATLQHFVQDEIVQYGDKLDELHRKLQRTRLEQHNPAPGDATVPGEELLENDNAFLS